jgi:hypothetical protein
MRALRDTTRAICNPLMPISFRIPLTKRPLRHIRLKAKIPYAVIEGALESVENRGIRFGKEALAST